jgi:hypothetical protein
MPDGSRLWLKVPAANFLDGYELANESVRRFWVEFPVGRLSTSIIETLSDLEKGYVTIKAEVFREFEDFQPAATGYAFGNVATYPVTMKKFYVEDTETSALARAIKTLSPSAERPSVEDMVKVEGLKLVPEMPTASVEIQVSESRDPWSFGSVLEDTSKAIATPNAPVSCRHGAMGWKEGVSEKTGKPFSGWVCQEKNRDQQCKAIWL